MGPCNRGGELEQLVVGVGEERAAELGVELHLAPFGGGERAWLGDQPGRDRQLAEVVESGRRRELGGLLVRHPEPAGELADQDRQAADVIVGLRVS